MRFTPYGNDRAAAARSGKKRKLIRRKTPRPTAEDFAAAALRHGAASRSRCPAGRADHVRDLRSVSRRNTPDFLLRRTRKLYGREALEARASKASNVARHDVRDARHGMYSSQVTTSGRNEGRRSVRDGLRIRARPSPSQGIAAFRPGFTGGRPSSPRGVGQVFDNSPVEHDDPSRPALY